jgi:type I restriction enzyme S subunit
VNHFLLAEVCDINPSMDANIGDETLCSFVPMEFVDEISGMIAKTNIRRVGDVKKGYTFFRDDDVIFAKITPCMENGKCAIARNLNNGIAFGSTEFHVIRARKDIIPEWTYFFLRQEKIRKRATHWFRGTAGQQRVPGTFLEELTIPLPPLPEQRRIADLLARADRLRRLRRYARELSDTYLQSVFVEMFGDPVRNEKGWERVAVTELGKVQTGNTPSREESVYFGNFIEWIKSDNIVGGQLYVTKSREMLSEVGLRKGRSVNAGAVLITCIAGSLPHIGDVALTNRKVSFNQQINAISPFRDVSPMFLYSMFNIAKPYIQFNATAGMKHILTKSKLEELVLIKPPLAAQERFADVVSRYESLRAQQADAERQAEMLFQSLLAQAFA